MTNRELKARVEELTRAGEITRARLRRFGYKFGWAGESLAKLTEEWDAITPNLDRDTPGKLGADGYLITDKPRP